MKMPCPTPTPEGVGVGPLRIHVSSYPGETDNSALDGVHLALSYDTSRLQLLSPANVLPGSLTQGFTFHVDLNATAGTVNVDASGALPPFGNGGPGGRARVRSAARVPGEARSAGGVAPSRTCCRSRPVRAEKRAKKGSGVVFLDSAAASG